MKRLIVSTALWCGTAALLAANTKAEPTPVSPLEVAQQEGAAVGRALLQVVDPSRRKAFIAGLASALEHPEITHQATTELGAYRRQWLQATETSLKQRASYAYGYAVGERTGGDTPLYSRYEIVLGLLESLQTGDRPYIAEEEAIATLNRYQRSRFYQQKRQVAEQIRDNERAGEAFLLDNAGRDGVIATAAGLQYRILSPGEGAHPVATDTVELESVIRTIDGETVYAATRSEGDRPLRIRVDAALLGWQQVLPLMKEGAEWEVFLPSRLAYGNAGWQNTIQPGETVIFRLKLLNILDRPASNPGE